MKKGTNDLDLSHSQRDRHFFIKRFFEMGEACSSQTTTMDQR
jgi:hypothetical protein